MNPEIEKVIKINRFKIYRQIVFVFIFNISIWYTLLFKHNKLDGIVEIILQISTISFLIAFIVVLKPLFYISKNGIIYNEEGFEIKSSIVSEYQNFVKWAEIKDVSMKKISLGRYSSLYLILIKIDNYDLIINNETNCKIKKKLKGNFKNFDSSIVINTYYLKGCEFEIFDLFSKRYFIEQHKKFD